MKKNTYKKGQVAQSLHKGQAPFKVDPTQRMMGQPEKYFWGALVSAIPAVMNMLSGSGGGGGGGGGGGLLGGLLGGGGGGGGGIGGLLSGILGGGKKETPPAPAPQGGQQPIYNIVRKYGGGVPSRNTMANTAAPAQLRPTDPRLDARIKRSHKKYFLGSIVQSLLGGLGGKQ